MPRTIHTLTLEGIVTTQEVKQLFAYNAWATNRLFDALGSMPEEQLTNDMQSSHHSILETMVHIVGAERIWHARWIGAAEQQALTLADAPTLKALKELWTKVGFETAKFLGELTDKKLLEIFEMKTLKGDVFKHIYWQAMMHLLTHSAFHRGQVITMMRQQGVVPPTTGMTVFFREVAKLGSNKG